MTAGHPAQGPRAAHGAHPSAGSPTELVIAGPPQGHPPPPPPSRMRYLLRHGDDNLILTQRLSEWIARAPELEEDIALANLGLDHLGQARALLQAAAELEGAGRTEDDLAFGRTEREYTNLILVEQPNGDFAHTMARELFFDAYAVELWQALSVSTDDRLAAIAAKAVMECRYHLRHAATWVVRLGDGTEESHRRMQTAIDALWPFTLEPFVEDELDVAMIDEGIGVSTAALREPWLERVRGVLDEAGLALPADPYRRVGGRVGFHGEHLGHLLTEMQWMYRAFPGATW